jgi:hypothetical protein
VSIESTNLLDVLPHVIEYINNNRVNKSKAFVKRQWILIHIAAATPGDTGTCSNPGLNP